MWWTERVNRLAGAILILMALSLILTIGLSIPIGDANSLDREEIRDFLTDIEDSRGFAIASTATSITLNAFLGVLGAAALYLVFRSRDRVLAIAGFAGILAGTIGIMASDAFNGTMIFLARDFAVGGVEGVPAESEVILQTARTVAILSAMAFQLGLTALSLGLLVFGTLIAFSRATGIVPPRWLGFLAIVAGLAGVLAWFIALTEAAFVFFIIGLIGMLLWLLLLGYWLLTRAPAGGEAEPAGAAVAP
jgi:hypothetical protein